MLITISYHSLTGNDIFTRVKAACVDFTIRKEIISIGHSSPPYVKFKASSSLTIPTSTNQQVSNSSIQHFPRALKYAPEATYTAFHPPPVARKQISWPDTTRDKMAIRFPAYPIFPPFPLSPRPAIQSGHIHQASYIDNGKTKQNFPQFAKTPLLLDATFTVQILAW
ncbi:uncharacterized protein TrAFT101_004141 [Trichoderma asperellum]|uniref:Uncharacterized protein n=1 Tax=Trichoderma asperellum (strain ATCC 204424 / CBS 433.97 / NBRC 101777) TaxID=1042311 RepID=A0A2T3ZNP1_TRIA4|nr:hypothetical protein M441DRAFT_215264 [Trichoderma asperellum CBS 433.97]PTB46404.1 hypothetical protein M441DRAFT_215264 [Trichoderma asperellum CBS 433.97]UKZ88383.1 hypothetical protein TrAFT101_004141 [Trichoderma asperellum]